MNDLVAQQPQSNLMNYSQAVNSPQLFEQCLVMAKFFAQSTIVPEIFQRNPSNCMIALSMASELQLQPLAVMNELYIVYGKPGWSAKFAIAQANKRGPFKDRIKFREEGKVSDRSLKVTAYATLDDDSIGEAYCDLKMADAEGWSTKKGNKYLTMPEQMLTYRAGTFLVRKYCPEVLMGLMTKEEHEDVGKPVMATNSEKIEKTLIAEPEGIPKAPLDRIDNMLERYSEFDVSEADILKDLGYTSKDQINVIDMDKLLKDYMKFVADQKALEGKEND